MRLREFRLIVLLVFSAVLYLQLPSIASAAHHQHITGREISSFLFCDEPVCVPLAYSTYGTSGTTYNFYAGGAVTLTGHTHVIILEDARTSPCLSPSSGGARTDVYEYWSENYYYGTMNSSGPSGGFVDPNDWAYGGNLFPNWYVQQPLLSMTGSVSSLSCLGFNSISWSYNLP